MRYRHVDSLFGREAMVVARIERSWLWYRISVVMNAGLRIAPHREAPGYVVAKTYALTGEGAYRQARRILGARNT